VRSQHGIETMNDNRKPLPGAWTVVALLWFVAALNYLDRMTINTMRGSIVTSIPMTDAQFGLLTSVFLWVYGALNPFAGFLADRYSRSRIIVVSMLVWSTVTWLTGHAKTYEQLLITRGLMGISEAAYLPAALALIADYHCGTTRSLATGIHMTGITVGAGLGGMGGYLADHYEWNFAFQLFGGIGIVYSLFLAALLRDAPITQDEQLPANESRTPNFFAAMWTLFRSSTFLILLLFWGLLGLSSWAVGCWMPTYLNEQFQVSQGQAGLLATGYVQGAAFLGVLIGGAWADRWSNSNARGRLLVCVIGLCTAAPGVLLVASTNTLNAALAGLVIFGMCKSFTDANLMPILCQVVDRRYRATGYGLLNFCNAAVGGLTTYAGGRLRDVQINVSQIFVLASGSLVVCALLLLFIKTSRTLGNDSPSDVEPMLPNPLLATKPM